MKRRDFIQNTSLTAALLSFSTKSAWAALMRPQDYNFMTLRDSIGIFTEAGGTIGWLDADEGYLVIDAQFPHSAAHLIAELKKLGSKPFSYLINTHHHGDHTAGNIAFKGLVGKVVAHNNSLINQKAVAKKSGKESEQLYPDTVFTESWELKTGKEFIKAHYFGAGHTNGDAIVHFQNANIVHMGDLVFNRRYPFIDKSAGADIASWIQVLQKAMDTFDRDTLFIFGHSLDPEKVVGGQADLKAFQDYLSSLLEVVSSKIKAGESREEIMKIASIPGASEWQGDGIERSLDAAYQELTQ